MMRSLFSVAKARVSCVLALVCLSAITACQATERGPVGLEALSRLDFLPYLWTGRQAAHVSSHDPTGGNNDRGNYLATSGLTKTLFDAKGAGCIYRIWTTNQLSSTNYTPTAHGDIRIYVDGALVVNTTMADFFSGSYSVFQSPLVGPATASSGGFYCYLPIPYRTGCRIEWLAPDTATPGLYYNIDYMTFDSPDGVTSFTGNENVSAVKEKWQSPGVDPKPTQVAQTFTGVKTIPKGGGKATVLEITGPGCISAVKLRCDTTGSSHSEWWNMIVRIYFDGHNTPDVQTTFGRFFGGEFYRPTDRDLTGLLFGTVRSTGWNYNYFPMPFASSARIEIQNNDAWADQDVGYQVAVSDMPDAGRLLSSGQIGYFRNTQRLDLAASIGGQDYDLLDTAGRGVVVGYVYAPQSSDGSRSYLEGDERIHVDDSLTPAIYGTGTEDTFNGGWYFKYGEFCLPSHGFSAWYSSPDGRALYRLLMGDSIPYSSRVKFGFEVGPKNDLNGVNTAAHMYSTVYYYSSPVPSTLALTDVLDVGNTTSEANHAYTVSASSLYGPYTRSARYEGDNDNVSVTENGRHFVNGYTQFTLNIRPDNYGVKLRRMSYYAVAGQDALVYVDGQLVGPWYDAGSNTVLCWRDSDFMIPASFTQGKSSITVKIVSSGQWTEYKYQAFSYISPSTPPPSPAVTDDGDYASSDSSLHFTWARPDEPVWGIARYEYAIGTKPAGTDITDWTDAGTGLEMTVSGLSLEQGKVYYISVRANNGVGVWSSPGVSDGITACMRSAAALKALADGTEVALGPVTVTALFDGGFYVETGDRASGIRADSSEVVSEGDSVYLTGTLATVNGERRVYATKVARG